MNEHGHSAFLVCEDSVLSESFSGKSYDEVLAAEVITSPVQTLREFSMMGEAKNSSFLCRRSLTAGGDLSSPSARSTEKGRGGPNAVAGQHEGL